MNDRSGNPADAALSGDVAVFSAWLRETGRDFLALGETGGEARVRFIGPFQGAQVVWDGHFLALRHESLRLPAVPGDRRLQVRRSFIEIGAPGEQGTPLRVGLDIECFDAPAILKTIIMIRNYKRLRPGRHEFGEAAGQP